MHSENQIYTARQLYSSPNGLYNRFTPEELQPLYSR